MSVGKYFLKYFYCIGLQYSSRLSIPPHVYLERSERSSKYKTETVYKCLFQSIQPLGQRLFSKQGSIHCDRSGYLKNLWTDFLIKFKQILRLKAQYDIREWEILLIIFSTAQYCNILINIYNCKLSILSDQRKILSYLFSTV